MDLGEFAVLRLADKRDPARRRFGCVGARARVEKGQPRDASGRNPHHLQRDVSPHRKTGQGKAGRCVRQEPGCHAGDGLVTRRVDNLDRVLCLQRFHLRREECASAVEAGDEDEWLMAFLDQNPIFWVCGGTSELTWRQIPLFSANPQKVWPRIVSDALTGHLPFTRKSVDAAIRGGSNDEFL